MSRTIGRRAYAEMYGPTVGDRLRLADTALVLALVQAGLPAFWLDTGELLHSAHRLATRRSLLCTRPVLTRKSIARRLWWL